MNEQISIDEFLNSLGKPKEFKEEKIEIFDKNINLFEEVKSYSDVCRLLGQRELTHHDFNNISPEYRKKILAQAKLQQVEKLFNQDWVKDWANKNQYKHNPYFNISTTGSLGFLGSEETCPATYGVGAFYKDKETSDFVGKLFINLYTDIID